MSINFNDFIDESLIEKKFTITTYDLDMKFSSTMPVICNYLYEVGMAHANVIMKDDDNMPKDVVFILTRLQIRIERFPMLRENILIRSWLSPIESKHVVRNFLLINESGEIFGRALNSATTFNIKKRAAEDVSARYKDTKFKTLDWEPALPHVFEKLPKVDSPDYENEEIVRYFDCDFYRHVNNVKYVEWCIETMPIEFIKKHQLYEIDINYKRESSLGEKLKVKTCADAGRKKTYFHSITNEDETKDIVRMKSVWK
jgi:acyl-ACP thioesterase